MGKPVEYILPYKYDNIGMSLSWNFGNLLTDPSNTGKTSLINSIIMSKKNLENLILVSGENYLDPAMNYTNPDANEVVYHILSWWDYLCNKIGWVKMGKSVEYIFPDE